MAVMEHALSSSPWYARLQSLFLLLSATTCVVYSQDVAVTLEDSVTVRYTFSEADCMQGSFPPKKDPNFSPLVNNASDRNLFCLPDLGVQPVTGSQPSPSPLLSSPFDRELLELQSHQHGIDFGLWFAPQVKSASSSSLSSIVAIRRSSRDARGTNYCDQQGVDLEILQSGDTHSLVVYYRTSEIHFESCQRVVLPMNDLLGDYEDSSPPLTHLAISLRDGHQILSLNGAPQLTQHEPFSNGVSHWAGQTIELLDPAWSGILYQMTFFQAIDVDRMILADKLPMTPPLAKNAKVMISEDAEIGTHYDNPIWYQLPPTPQESATIELQDISVTSQAHDLFEKHGYPITTPRPPMFVYLTLSPSQGSVYSGDGNEQLTLSTREGSPQHGLIAVPTSSIVYLPPHNTHSSINYGRDESENLQTFETIEYCLSDSLIIHQARCRSAKLDIVVIPVNDPPTAVASMAPVRMQEGSRQRIPLLGVDVDRDDAIRRVEVTEYPKYGRLQLHVGSFREDGLVHGTPVNSSIVVDAGAPGGIYVVYTWDSYKYNRTLLGDSFATDSFSFRVSDELGAWSSNEKVYVQIESALTGFADMKNVTEDSKQQGNLLWHARDNSGYERDVRYIVETIPNLNEGALVDVFTGKILQEGSMISASAAFPYQNGTMVTFLPAADFCTSHTEASVEVQFRILAYRDDGAIDATSHVVNQRISVECQADYLDLSFSDEPLMWIAQQTLEGLTSSKCRTNDCPAVLSLHRLRIQTVDQHNDSALVTLSSSQGSFLTFNQQHWNKTIAVFGRRELSSGGASFYAKPYDLNGILSGLQFESLEIGNQALNITIEYGAGCGSTDTNADCHKLFRSTNISVEAVEIEVLPRIQGFFDLKSMLALVIGFFVIPLGGWAWITFFERDHETETENDDAATVHDEAPEFVEINTGDFPYFINVADYNIPDPKKTYRVPRGAVVVRDEDFRRDYNLDCDSGEDLWEGSNNSHSDGAEQQL